MKCIRYFLGNGLLFDAKICKNTNSKQVKSSFFSDLLKYATKIYQDMMILFDHARYSYILFSKMLFPSRRLEKHCCRRFLSMFFCFHLFSCE